MIAQTERSGQASKIKEVSKSDPCPHCGKPDWCYSLGELTVCKREAEPATGWVKTSKTDADGTYYYAPQTQKAVRPRQKKEFVYSSRDGQLLVKVTRIDDGEGHRRFYQSHWDGTNWQKGLTAEVKSQIPIYRYQEVREAISAGRPVFVVEGEGVCDTLWELGLAATTTLGGSGKYRTYGSYKADLEGASLVLCPDRDMPGLEHMKDVCKDFPDAKWLYAPPSDFYWTHLPKNGGIDIADWVRDGATAEMIMQAIQQRQSVVDNLNEAFKSPDARVTRTRSLKKELLSSVSACWGEKLRFNEMTLSVEFDGKPMDLDCLSIKIADELDIDVGNDTANQIVHYLAKNNTYHPVRDYLSKIASKYQDTPKNQQVFNTIATRYFGTNESLYDTFLSKTMIGAVARIFDPGCKFDTICTLQGKQGLKKSTFWETLAVGKEWFDDGLSSSNTSDKDEKMKLRSSWILELAEIESLFKKKEVSSFRGFVTSKIDNLRLPYGRTIKKFPRTSIFVGSVNPNEFLVDPEGHRRYWVVPVKCDRINTELLEKEHDLLWAMAVQAYNRGETTYLNHEQEQRNALLNKRYEVSDSWQEVIEFWLENESETTVSKVLSDCLKIEIGRHDRQSQMRVVQILKALDWEKQSKCRINGKVTQIWRDRKKVATEVATEVATPRRMTPKCLPRKR
ncbi:MAG: VapE domain-containing protein [Rivularia sp. (in: cyanobacteria)]